MSVKLPVIDSFTVFIPKEFIGFSSLRCSFGVRTGLLVDKFSVAGSFTDLFQALIGALTGHCGLGDNLRSEGSTFLEFVRQRKKHPQIS